LQEEEEAKQMPIISSPNTVQPITGVDDELLALKLQEEEDRKSKNNGSKNIEVKKKTFFIEDKPALTGTAPNKQPNSTIDDKLLDLKLQEELDEPELPSPPVIEPMSNSDLDDLLAKQLQEEEEELAKKIDDLISLADHLIVIIETHRVLQFLALLTAPHM